MITDLNFRGICPKCKKDATFLVKEYSPGNHSQIAEDFDRDRWVEFEYFLFSISSKCPNCLHFISSNIATPVDEQKNKSTDLKVFANAQGELIEGKDIQILIDHPPLIPPQYPSGRLVAQPHDLYTQAKLCFEMNAWDAVGMLCRKIIDIQTKEKWDRKSGNPLPSSLFDRIKIIYKDREENYFADAVRMIGNDAAHSVIAFGRDEAESIIVFTESFL